MSAPSETPTSAPGPAADGVTDAPGSSSMASGSAPASPTTAAVRRSGAGAGLLAVVALLVAVGAGWLAWQGGQRGSQVEQELVRRQQDTQAQLTEARSQLAQARETLAQTQGRLSALEAQLADSASQRQQLQELAAALSRSREENLLVEVEAGLRMAQQYSQVTGSVQPLLLALRQADERLGGAGHGQDDAVRRAIARDLEAIRATALSDLASLALRVDELMRAVDDLPLRATPGTGAGLGTGATESAHVRSAQGSEAGPWWSAQRWSERWAVFNRAVAEQARELLRVTRIDQPDAVLLAPEQAVFLRENLKLKLLNARLGLLSRQLDMAQADLRLVETTVERYFDLSSRRTQQVLTQVRQVAEQARPQAMPRPDHTLAALASVMPAR